MHDLRNDPEEKAWTAWEGWPVTFAIGLTLLFLSMFFNRFAGLRSGDGEFAGGMASLAHRLPYRDYYTAGPPLNQIKSALELAVFGKTLLVSRLCGVVERLVIVAVLYAWLRRHFTALAAMLASFVTVVISAGDQSDPIASYNHDSLLLAMVCGLAASLSLEDRFRKWQLWLAVAAGFAAGLSSLTKQTVGLGAAVSMLTLGSVAVARLVDVRRGAVWAASYLGGFLVPLAAMTVLLGRLGVLRDALRMSFLTGPAAKASAGSSFLGREIFIAGENWLWVVLGLVACAASAVAIAKSAGRLSPRKEAAGDSVFWAAAGGLATLAASFVAAWAGLPALHHVSLSSVYYVLFGTTVLGAACLVQGLRGEPHRRLRLLQMALFAGLAWSNAVTLSLSWPAFEAMALPGLGLLLAATTDGASRLGRALLGLVMAAIVSIQVGEKLELPFVFDHLAEPTTFAATQVPALPMLRGMRLPPETLRLLTDISNAAEAAHASGEGSGFSYPEVSLFYSLGNLVPPTISGSHNIDVVPDEFAREEAERLLKAPPQVLLYARPSEQNLTDIEALWRGGRRSGQRDLIAAMDSLLPQYQLIGTYTILEGDPVIRLYMRRPRGTATVCSACR